MAWHCSLKRNKEVDRGSKSQGRGGGATAITIIYGTYTANESTYRIEWQEEEEEEEEEEKKRQSDENIAKRHLPPGYLTKESKPCRIFYGTRTQAQVKNVVREIKALAYSPDLAVLGSRQFLCACKDELGKI